MTSMARYSQAKISSFKGLGRARLVCGANLLFLSRTIRTSFNQRAAAVPNNDGTARSCSISVCAATPAPRRG
jgi:hypothetical protein